MTAFEKDSCILFQNGLDTVNGGFTFSNDNVPFDKYNWETWTEAVKICYENAEKDSLYYVDSQYLGFDGYRENEVDLIVPNKPRKCSDN